MTPDALMERLRASDPVTESAVTAADEIFQHIVSGPGDPRLHAAERGRRGPLRRWARTAARPFPLLAALVVVTGAAAATTGVIGILALTHAQPRRLFIANPAGMFRDQTHQSVVPRSVRLATTFTVPGAGRFQYWVALSRQGWLCEAIRQPDGTWADLGTPHDRYRISGPAPGCGRGFWHDAEGFDYYPTSIQTQRGGWRIAYGYAPTTGHPAVIRDVISGATAPVGDGRFFAIVIPMCRGRRCLSVRPRPHAHRFQIPFRGFRLETLDASGQRLVIDRYDPGM